MDELYFLGADIVVETKNMLNLISDASTNGMTENEVQAYQMGVTNTLSALKTIVDENDLPVINICGIEVQTELSIDDLEEYYGSM